MLIKYLEQYLLKIGLNLYFSLLPASRKAASGPRASNATLSTFQLGNLLGNLTWCQRHERKWGTQTSKPLAFKNTSKLPNDSSFAICNVSTLLPGCNAAPSTPFFCLSSCWCRGSGVSESQVMRRAATHADGPNGGGGDERGGGRTLTRFDQGVIDCHRDGAPSRRVGTRQRDSPEALFVADGSHLMSYLGQSPVTIACTGEKQGEERRWWQDINND